MRKMPVLLAGLLAAACSAPAAQTEPAAPRPAEARAFDPVGTYDFTTEVQGSAVAGTVTVKRGDQGLSADIATDVTGSFPATVTLDGRKLAMRATTPQGNMVMNMTVDEQNAVTGSWSLDTGLSGNITGKRRP